MLVTLREVLEDADKHGYAVPAFNVNNLEIMKAVVEAAVAARSPVIVQTSEGAIAYAGMDYLVAMAQVSGKSAVPMVLHLDHGKNMSVIHDAIMSGYTSVMFDGSLLPLADNIEKTVSVVELARTRGVSVEAELGAIKGMEDLVRVEDRQAFMTDPEQAAEFVESTGCDALAVSIGTAHGAHKFHGDAVLDLERLRAIDAMVSVPLVLHGASGVNESLIRRTIHLCESFGDCGRLAGAVGVPDEAVVSAVQRGIRKVNIDTDLRIAFTAGMRESLVTMPEEIDPRKLMDLSKKLMMEVVAHKMDLLRSAGKA
jgi:fructose-bisphosphate aldolase class II